MQRSLQPANAVLAAIETTGFDGRAAFLHAMRESWQDYSIVADDIAGRIIAWNDGARAVYGYEAAEILGKKSFILCAGDEVKNGCAARMLRTARETGSASGILTHLRKNGQTFPALVTMTRRLDRFGAVIGSTIVSRDVTDVATNGTVCDARALLVHDANRQKRAFLASMSHELRTPLNTIIGLSELLRGGQAGPLTTMQAEYLGDVLAASEDLQQLLNDVRDLAKLRAGKMVFRLESFDLDRVIDEVRNGLRSLSVPKRIEVCVDMAEGLHDIVGDAIRVRQVLRHYLSNALKFAPEGGRVTIRARREGADDCRLEVEDTGIGIAPEDVGRLFGPFDQLDSSVTSMIAGTGVGLALIKHLIEAQGGRVGVRSTIGVGTTFHAVLPIGGRSADAPLGAASHGR